MGTHSYTTSVIKVPKGGSNRPPEVSVLNFKTTNAEATRDVEELSPGRYLGYTRAVRQNGCREAIANNVRSYLSWMIADKTHYYVVGIRCFGDQYNSVSRIIKKYVGSEKTLQDVISELLKMPVSLDRGSVPESKWQTYGRGADRRTIFGKNKLIVSSIRNYVTLYIKSWEQTEKPLMSVRVSTILALLREPIFCERIIKGEITNYTDAVKCLVEIAENRIFRKDLSYYPWLVLVKATDMSQRFSSAENVRDYLESKQNSDGSDWYSILHVAIFLHEIGTRRRFADAIENGPVTLITESYSSTDYKMFADNFVSEKFRKKVVDLLDWDDRMYRGFRK